MQIYPVFLPLAGCPHRCLFCRQEGSADFSGAPLPAATEHYLDRILPLSGDGEIAFFGGTFTLLSPALQCAYLEAAGRFVRLGRVRGIRISTRPDALGSSAVALLADMGVTTVEIGCQSFSEAVLLLSERGHGAEEAAQAVFRLRAAGLQVGLQLMPGLPGGDRGEALFSLEAALALGPDFLRIYPAAVFRGTEIESLWLRGIYRPLALSEAVDLCAELLWRCRRAGVPVIRLGLQGTPALEAELVAGPWHPAFGQLVRSRLWLRALEKGVERTASRRVLVHPSDLADVLGHRRGNFNTLRERFPDLVVTGDPAVPRGVADFGPVRLSVDHLAYEE